jgi:hypothetical protein
MNKDQVSSELHQFAVLFYSSFLLSIQALYVIDDPNNPPPKELKEFTYKELQFMQSYFEKNGILWQHYYGPNGPRPPPSLFMWPATKVGEVHSVTSSHGHW